jgi:hypothetical protein
MDETSAKRAAQEYLAARLSEEAQEQEDHLNLEAAIALGPRVWQELVDSFITQCREWNSVTNEQTLMCNETALGDLRVWCSGKSHQIIVHYDSKMRSVTIENTARPENEPDTILHIEGYATDGGRGAHLVRNKEPVNRDMMVLGHLRVLAGLSRRADA